ncbi:MAG TPA: glycosyltransferase family 2 protein [Fibrobacteraceae bacterium]|nr:glycosyltransferase family 2 protein [Fibrobacteraceae bacterium]
MIFSDPFSQALRRHPALSPTPWHGTPTGKAPRTHVFIYTWNKAKILEATLDSLAHTEGENWKLFLLDNGSTDDTLKIAFDYRSRQCFPQMEIIPLPVNVGAPAARNWLAAMPENRHADFLAYLDDDILLSTDWLQRLLRVFEHYPYAGVSGAKILFDQAPPFIQHTGGIITRVQDWHTSINCQNWVEDHGQHDYCAPRHYVMGCCHIYRREVFDVCGNFDLRFSPTQFDEVEHQIRMRLYGYQAIYNGGVRIIHKLQSGSQTSPASQINREANRAKMLPLFSNAEIQWLVQENLMNAPHQAVL